MRIDCTECMMQGTAACRDCVVSHILVADFATPIELDVARTDAIGALVKGGLVPTLRLIPKAANE
jgi:hypothetical protein